MIGWLIVACEIGFWVLVLAGLFARYMMRRPRLGGILLLLTPLVDLFLLAFTVIDMKNGAEAGVFHGLAAVYIGVTVAFGHRMIRWADERFAYRFAGGAKPRKASRYGSERARAERAGWYRHLLAWAIGTALMMGMILLVGNPEQTGTLLAQARIWTVVLAIDFIISFSYTIWPKKEERRA